MFNLVKKKKPMFYKDVFRPWLFDAKQPLYIKLKETIIIFTACSTFFGHFKCINLSVSYKSTCLN